MVTNGWYIIYHVKYTLLPGKYPFPKTKIFRILDQHVRKRRQGLFRHDVNATAAPPDPKSDADIKLMKNVCSTIPGGKYADWTKTPVYYMADNLHLSYCVVRHEMNDIWRDVFHVLRNMNNKSVNYGDLLGHYDRPPSIREKVPFKSITRRRSETILYVRNPYYRLFAAYYDRFYVLHHSCEPIGFQEYLDRIISGVKLHLNWGTVMMPPLVPLCALCDIRPFEIVKEETFLKDITHMFGRLKLNATIQNTLRSLLENPKLFMTAILHSKIKLQFLETCPELRFELLERLWQSLQNMGLISASLPHPTTLRSIDVSRNISAFVDAVLSANKIAPMTDEERITQRRKALTDAYADIKEETIEYIQEAFRYDFDMFGYSKNKPV